MRWATCTENPVETEAHNPQKSHVVVDTNPMEADASAPRLPTIAASIYCMIMAESWVTMAGTLKAAVRRNCSPKVMGRPSRMRASKPSVSFALFSMCGHWIFRMGFAGTPPTIVR